MVFKYLKIQRQFFIVNDTAVDYKPAPYAYHL